METNIRYIESLSLEKKILHKGCMKKIKLPILHIFFKLVFHIFFILMFF